MSLVLSDERLDEWIQQNGQVPPGYGDLKCFLQECDKAEAALTERLRNHKQSPDWPQLFFVPRQGLSDIPF